MCLVCFFFLMIRRPPRATRTDTSFPTRRSSDLYDNNWSSAGIDETVGVAAMGAGSGELAGWRTSGAGGVEGDDFGLENTLSDTPTLRDHLLAQMGVEIAAPGDRLIAAHLIDLVDPAGYLSGSIEPIAEQLGCPLPAVERVLERLQRLDPAGVLARDLKECLALQLRDRNRFDPCMAALLDHLPMLAQRDFAGLRRVCGVDDEDLAEMIAEIKRSEEHTSELQ